MKHIDCKTPQGRAAEADFFRKNRKDWVRVRLFAYHTSYEYRLDTTSLEEALKSLDDNFASLEQAEEEYFEDWERCND